MSTTADILCTQQNPFTNHKTYTDIIIIMKAGTVLSLVSLFFSVANAFAPSPAFTRFQQMQRYASDPEEEEEEGGLDLNLEEMFDM